MTHGIHAPLTADLRRSDWLLAAGVTLGVFVGVGLAFALGRDTQELPVIDPGIGVPIAVTPVADVGAGSGDGVARTGEARPVPRAWRRRTAEPTQPTTPTTTAAPTAVKSNAPRQAASQAPAADAEPLPSPDPNVDPAADPNAAPSEADPDAAASEPVEVDPQAPPGEGGGAGEGAGMSGVEGAGAGEGEAGGAGGGGGSGDPLFDRAVAFYRARLVSWFSARFRVSGSGLSSAELTKQRVRVQIDIGEDLSIVDYRVLSSDHPAFDAAARAMLDKLIGTKLPPPPENYPGAVQRQLTVTFTCAEDTCD